MVKISKNNTNEIGKSITRVGMLDIGPLCVYGCEEIPDKAVPICSLDRCVAKGILTVALDKKYLHSTLMKTRLKDVILVH